MAAYGQPPDPNRVMRGVQPRTGLPVRNMGGIPQTPMTSPQRPFLAGPTVAPPPGPAAGAAGAPGVGTAGSWLGRPAQPTPAPGAPQQQPGIQPGGAGGWGKISTTPVSGPPPAAPPPAPPSAGPAPTPPAAGSPATRPGQPGAAPQGAGTLGGWNLEGQLQDYLKQGFAGSVSPEFINRAKQDVFRNVQGQTRQATNQINEDAIRRGLFRSGIPAESIANVQGQAQGAMARGVADILNSAEAQNIQGRQQAGSQASQLLGMNRSQAQYEQQRADAARARAAANAPRTFEYIDPDDPTGQVYTMDESWF